MVICGQEFNFSVLNANDMDRFEDANERMQQAGRAEGRGTLQPWRRASGRPYACTGASRDGLH